eukprot:3517507-Amphidinium_carterae.1
MATVSHVQVRRKREQGKTLAYVVRFKFHTDTLAIFHFVSPRSAQFHITTGGTVAEKSVMVDGECKCKPLFGARDKVYGDILSQRQSSKRLQLYAH